MKTTARSVTVIPPMVSLTTLPQSSDYVKKRVAAYARVSTDTEEQQNSYEAQVKHYTRHIQENEDWEFAGVYTDEGLSATSTKHRDGFNSMIQDALDGKIDFILTKSVSRFARNTVDSLTAVRKLKEKGVEIYFEKENIYTMDSKGELLITIMSSLAQEESRSISENVTWGQRKRMRDGKVSMPYKHFLGYEKGEDGIPKIVEKEAEIVRLIYTLFLQGKTHSAIARHLTEAKIPTPAGREKWSVSTVLSILKNEKYKGDALLQKIYTVDFLTKKRKINNGEVPQYYVENSHPAIVTPEVYNLVQAEIEKRKPVGRRQSAVSCFSSKIICGECGGFYGSKVWHSTSKYRRTIWQCNNKFKGENACGTPHLYETAIQAAFVEAFNQIAGDMESIVEAYTMIIDSLTDSKDLDKEIDALHDECGVVRELIRKCVEDNTFTANNQDECVARYETLCARYEERRHRHDETVSEKQSRIARRETLTRFLGALRSRDGMLAEFDKELWCVLVESMTVVSESRARIVFKDGREICVGLGDK